MKNIENLDSYRRIILEAVLTLKDANDILKNDKAVVLSAVKNTLALLFLLVII